MSKALFAIINTIIALIVIWFVCFGFLMGGGYQENLNSFEDKIFAYVVFPLILFGSILGLVAGWVVMSKPNLMHKKLWWTITLIPGALFVWLVSINF